MIFNAMDAAAGFAGGLLIGGAAALLLLLNGRIAGVSGALGALASLRPGPGIREHGAFVAGLIAAPLALAPIFGAPEIGVTGAPLLLIAGGLLVGIGTRIGGGCTSGHGVCGMTRLSPRSLVATGVFMAVAALVVAIMNGLGG